jgi:hypothetical protein
LVNYKWPKVWGTVDCFLLQIMLSCKVRLVKVSLGTVNLVNVS